jgi:hypothetical protein
MKQPAGFVEPGKEHLVLGNEQYCLGVNEGDRTKKHIFLSQKAYIEQLVEKFGLSEYKPCFYSSQS